MKRWIICMFAFACCKSEPTTTMVLDQKPTDAMTGDFEGKVLRSTHPKVTQGSRCQGTIARAKAAPTAAVAVRCGEVALYAGTGTFTFDPKDPTRRDDDKSEYDDPVTSDKDKTPGCHMVGENGKADGAGGTLNIWDTATDGLAAYEIVIAL